MIEYLKYFALLFSVVSVVIGWREYTKDSTSLTSEAVLHVLKKQKKCPLPLPKLEPVPWREDTWLLLEDWSYLGIFIPRYFFCDLDSIPRIPYVYTYLKGYARTAAMVHDWLYADQSTSRAEADRVFYDFMVLEGVHRVRAGVIYGTVRVFGCLYYGKKLGVREALMAPEVRDVDYT